MKNLIPWLVLIPVILFLVIRIAIQFLSYHPNTIMMGG